MATGFGIHGSTTNHGGIVLSTQSRSSQMGNLFLRAGDGFFCPVCKCWSTLIKSNDHIIFDGKPVAFAGDKFTCGATLLLKQMHVVGDSGSANSTNSEENKTSNFVASKIYDEQVQLIIENEASEIFNFLSYKATVGNQVFEGSFDSEGKTSRFVTDQAEEISKFEVFLKGKFSYFHEL